MLLIEALKSPDFVSPNICDACPAVGEDSVLEFKHSQVLSLLVLTLQGATQDQEHEQELHLLVLKTVVEGGGPGGGLDAVLQPPVHCDLHQGGHLLHSPRGLQHLL